MLYTRLQPRLKSKAGLENRTLVPTSHGPDIGKFDINSVIQIRLSMITTLRLRFRASEKSVFSISYNVVADSPVLLKTFSLAASVHTLM